MDAFLEPWSSWLRGLDERVLSTAILGLALYVAVRLAEWAAHVITSYSIHYTKLYEFESGLAQTSGSRADPVGRGMRIV